MAITQYRTNYNGVYRYSAPNSNDVSAITPAVGDWMAIKTNEDYFLMLSGEFEDGNFTGTGYRVGADGIFQEDLYTNEAITVYDNYYVYSNMDGYRTVNNIRASTACSYFLMSACVVLWAYIVVGGAFKCVKRVLSSRRSRYV